MFTNLCLVKDSAPEKDLLHYELCTMHCALCTMQYALCIVPHSPLCRCACACVWHLPSTSPQAGCSSSVLAMQDRARSLRCITVLFVCKGIKKGADYLDDRSYKKERCAERADSASTSYAAKKIYKACMGR